MLPELEIFLANKSSANLSERTAIANHKWHEWYCHSVLLTDLSKHSSIRADLRKMGLYEWEDYIFRYGKEIRFRNADDCALVELLGWNAND
jgi:hypothetical protein